jgi:probable aminopeptidase NPEPL1
MVWVGKGIMYDTGGLSLKPKGSMGGMKMDMGGAAAVLGAFEVAAGRGEATDLCAILCLAENAIGPDAIRNDDIIRIYSGKTVEINNTDAEGRLVLGDGVAYATEHLDASVVVDVATLTGAQLVATGRTFAAVVSNDEALERAAVEVGRESGDLTHPLPYCPELLIAEFKSQVADMKNSVKDRMNAQSSCAGHFVEAHLTDPSALWLHIDIAGPAFIKERGTGYGVALLSGLARRWRDGSIGD